MRKLTYFVMVLAMVLGFTQCKKEQIATTENEGEKVTITLKLNNGSRGHIVPGENTASVVYDNGDIIMIGFNGAYVGDLSTTDGSTFSGDVDISGEPTDGKIYFYYLDGKSQSVNSGKCTVDISNQTGGLPVISYACVDYSSSNTYSNVKMHNQCGLVKFNTTNVAGAITISGVNNLMEVDFTAHSFTPKNPGSVMLNGTSGTTRWAILLPQDEGCSATVTASGYNNGTCSVPAISNNMYYTSGVEVSLTAAAATGHALSTSAIGEIICTDGLAYAAADKDNLPSGVTAVAMVAYRGNESDCNNGLAIALDDESDGTNPWDAIELCENKTAISDRTWRLPSIMDWQYMFIGCGASGTASDNPSSVSGSGMISKLSTAGGTSFPDYGSYWSSTQAGRYWWGLSFNPSTIEFEFGPAQESWPLRVRACLAF